MNKLTRHIVEHLLRGPEYWDTDESGNLKLKVRKLNKDIVNARESIYVDEVFWPYWCRFNRLLFLLKKGHPGYIDPEYNDSHFYCDEEGNPWLDCDDCIYEGQLALDRFFTKVFIVSHPEWHYEEVTEEMVLSLKILPKHYQPPLL